jgi:hypothetical protein
MLASYMGAVGRPTSGIPGFGYLSGVCGYRKCDIGPWIFQEIVHCRIQGVSSRAMSPDLR